MELNRLIDHTLLKQNATFEQIRKLCEEAREMNFKTVCVNPTWIQDCKKLLTGSNTEVCTVIGFPLGAMTTAAKAFEAKNAIEQGADEVDMVINIGCLKDSQMDEVVEDIRQVKQACGQHVLKVIIETCLLSKEEKIRACQACVEAGADFVKTSTGFSSAGATVEDVVLMKETVANHCQVKAAGGVKTYEDLLNMVKAGADRIGTSSGVALLQKKESEAEY